MITFDEILTSVKRNITVPANQALLLDDDFYAIADEVIASRIVPMIESLNQEFFVTTSRVALVASQSEYAIPYRAIGRTLRDLKLVDGTSTRSLPKIAYEDAHYFDTTAPNDGFYFKGDKIRLVPDVGSGTQSAELEMAWRIPPNKAQAVSAACKVASISGDMVTCVNVPSTFIAGTSVDFIQGRSGSSILDFDKSITSVAGSTLNFATGTVPSDLVAGDYIALAGYSPVVNMIPNECLALIRSHVSYKVLSAIGDMDNAKLVMEDVRAEEKDIKSLLEPRIDGEPTIIVNRRGLVRGNKAAQRRWLFGN